MKYIESCASTNDEILNFLPFTGSVFTTLYTFNQLNGRGQYGNEWKITPKQNIAFSLAIKVNDITLQPNLFNFYTAIVFRNFLVKITSSEVQLKWPNDIILMEKKVAGILIEKKRVKGINYYIIGIGINILQRDFEHLPKAGSLFTQTGLEFDLNNFAISLHKYFSTELMLYKTDEQIMELYNNYLFRKDLVSVFVIHDLRQNGTIKFADKEGFLWVELEHDGLQKFYHKEIELLYSS